MIRSANPIAPPPLRLPTPLLELCARLESGRLPAAVQGEGLLHALRPRSDDAAGAPGWSIVCAAEADRVLSVLPGAVVTAAQAARLTQPTPAGPVDVLCLAEQGGLEAGLARFALGALAFAYRPARAAWIDPEDQLRRFTDGRLGLVESRADAFLEAPRRLWIAARLIAEYALAPDPWLTQRARQSCAEIALALPQGASARRAMTRILSVPDPAPALAFLDEIGVTAVVAPGAQSQHAARIPQLPHLLAIRWAAWLRGSATARAMVTFRMPHDLGRRIERIQASHPLDRGDGRERDASLRRLGARVTPAEIDALIAWRRLELSELPDRDAARIAGERLDAVEARLAQQRDRSTEGDRIRTLALDGAAVMRRLGAGPGRHVGEALAHLAQLVAADPEANVRDRLERALDDWAEANADALTDTRAPRRRSIG
jgi:tRNA nucleotidyltransferase (CCA-adding enzyme)